MSYYAYKYISLSLTSPYTKQSICWQTKCERMNNKCMYDWWRLSACRRLTINRCSGNINTSTAYPMRMSWRTNRQPARCTAYGMVWNVDLFINFAVHGPTKSDRPVYGRPCVRVPIRIVYYTHTYIRTQLLTYIRNNYNTIAAREVVICRIEFPVYDILYYYII